MSYKRVILGGVLLLSANLFAPGPGEVVEGPGVPDMPSYTQVQRASYKPPVPARINKPTVPQQPVYETPVASSPSHSTGSQESIYEQPYASAEDLPGRVQGGQDDDIYDDPNRIYAKPTASPTVSEPNEYEDVDQVVQGGSAVYEAPVRSSPPPPARPPKPTRFARPPVVDSNAVYETPVAQRPLIPTSRRPSTSVSQQEQIYDQVTRSFQGWMAEDEDQFTSADVRRMAQQAQILQEESPTDVQDEQTRQAELSWWGRFKQKLSVSSRATVAPQPSARVQAPETVASLEDALQNFQQDYATQSAAFIRDSRLVMTKKMEKADFRRRYTSLIQKAEQLKTMYTNIKEHLPLLQSIQDVLDTNPTIAMRLQQVGALKISTLEKAMRVSAGSLLGSSVKSTTTLAQLTGDQVTTVFNGINNVRDYKLTGNSTDGTIQWLATPGRTATETLQQIIAISTLPVVRNQIPLILAGKPVDIASMQGYVDSVDSKTLQAINRVMLAAQ